MDNFTAFALFVYGEPRDDGLIPNLLISFSPDGKLEALAEQLLQTTEIPNTFKPVKAVRRAPHRSDQFQEVIAEKIAYRVIADLSKPAKSNSCRASIQGPQM